MFREWRVSSFNGAILAAYFIPAWTSVAWGIIVSPVHSLYERSSIGVALFISDHLQLSGMSTVRAAWLLALARLTVVAFFATFVAFAARPKTRKTGAYNEPLAMALGVGSLISFASMVMASQVGETAALKLHATELLLLLGGAIVLVMERSSTRAPAVDVHAVPDPKLLHNH